MARVLPFQPYRYAKSAGPLDHLVTQPYDKITPAMRERYLSLHPQNLVRIILSQPSDSDSEDNNAYTRAASLFKDWIAKGILVKEDAPAFYAYFQEFNCPDTGTRMVRKGFIGLGAVEEYSAGVVHRHEKTLSGPKSDRMRLLESTRAHFGQIFMLYDDSRNIVDQVLDETASGAPLASTTDEYGTIHTLWKISLPGQLRRIREAMQDKKLIIADGHHRYEASLAFSKAHPELEDSQFTMMTFVNMRSPGLRILATHRLVSGLASGLLGQVLERAPNEFRVRKLNSLQELQRAWAEPHRESVRIGLVTSEIHLLEREKRAGDLAVSVLHEVFLKRVLGIGEEAVRNENHLRYVRGAENAVEEVRAGRAQLGLLLEPTSIEEVASLVFSGGIMPQKSTDFFPKLLTGLAIYRLEK